MKEERKISQEIASQRRHLPSSSRPQTLDDPINSPLPKEPIPLHKSDHLKTPSFGISRSKTCFIRLVNLVENEVGSDFDPIEDFFCVWECAEVDTGFESVDAGEVAECYGVDEFCCVLAWGAVSVFDYLIYAPKVFDFCTWR